MKAVPNVRSRGEPVITKIALILLKLNILLNHEDRLMLGRRNSSIDNIITDYYNSKTNTVSA